MLLSEDKTALSLREPYEMHKHTLYVGRTQSFGVLKHVVRIVTTGL
jgi:hypothetical protein